MDVEGPEENVQRSRWVVRTLVISVHRSRRYMPGNSDATVLFFWWLSCSVDD